MRVPFFRHNRRDPRIAALYGAIVAQARKPAFYDSYGVPDTVNGRFDMVVLHLSLLLARLAREPDAVRTLGQAVFDAFCQDMDDNLREMGTGDLAVPKEMQRIAEAFYGRHAAYGAALVASDPAALASALGRNVFGAADAVGAEILARYVREVVTALARQDGGEIAAGRLAWPAPEAICSAGGVPKELRNERR
jgi:cytochrome b pre-mRNA-processing protein 3